MANEKAKFAVRILNRHSQQSGNLMRSTSDLSPLEEWLISHLYDEILKGYMLTGYNEQWD